MSKPRVLQVIRPAEGGMFSHLCNLIKGLSDDFDFTVACPKEVAERLAGTGVRILTLRLGRHLSPARDLAAAARLVQAIRGGSYDFVHAHGFKAGLVARPAAKAGCVPCLLTVHGDFDGARMSGLGPLYFQAERFLARWTTGYLTVSDWVAKELAASLGISRERLLVIPNGISFPPNSGFAGFSFPGGQQVVGTVARLAPQKGVEYFVRAAAFLAEQHPGLRFVVAGDGPERGRLEVLAQSLGLSNCLFFMGHHEEVPALLSALSVFAQPSLSEGQGITVLEAMAAGCPVVATAAGGLTELVRDGENGLLVTPGDAIALAGAIGTLLSDRVLAGKLVSGGRETVSRYRLDNMLAKTRHVYRRLLEGGWPLEEN